MKIRHLLAFPVLAAGLLVPAFAQNAAESGAAAAPKGAASSLTAQVQAIVLRVRGKLAKLPKGKSPTEADLAPEIADLEALAAKHAGEKSNEIGLVNYMRGTLYLQVLNEPDKALPILDQLQKDYAGTPLARMAKAASTRPLAAGAPAPDFTATDLSGGTDKISLSQYKGQVVIVDFWATWCGPCQRSLPHMQSVYQKVKGQGVSILGVCSWDTRDAYKKWLGDHKGQFTFAFAMDPAERDGGNSIATKLYGVTGIPTTYVIGKDGKVAAAIVGFEDGDHRIEDALRGLGISAL